MALALLPTMQPEAVFIPDTDSTAIKLRDSIEKWKVKKKYQYLQASLFISSPFGTSAYIIMVRLKCYILFHHRLVLQKTTASKTTSGHSHGEVPHPTPHTGCGDERSRSHRLPACQVPGRGRMDAETPGEEAGPRPRPALQVKMLCWVLAGNEPPWSLGLWWGHPMGGVATGSIFLELLPFLKITIAGGS